MRLRLPPGRSGKLWLRRRLGTARRGLDLLDRKLRILRREHDRLVLLSRETGREWARAAAEADAWTLRAALLGGERALRPAAGELTDVRLEWADVMGTSYPARVTCAFPPPPESLPLTAALVPARAACRTALQAAARHAAALAAARIVGAEVDATRRRIHALRERWVPALETALAELETALDELERADGIRVRRARREVPP
ncbi:V-type ATP synthase subunit D [Planobispora siamensis]|uniref:V/A-type H+-transporting ATPase subunit D n=1 Tax=Planobispora siamensis TaxID=936338 RepID=A0A8J3SN83_9ACTN|nr:V-type ATP synthase subunit D [Planobispora siamensis]GIH96314.1 hypothetical protein Psi01_69440 [Planobispora siamensis]